MGSYAVCAAVAVLAGCSANPTETENKKAITAKVETFTVAKNSVVKAVQSSSATPQNKKKQLVSVRKPQRVKPVVVVKKKIPVVQPIKKIVKKIPAKQVPKVKAAQYRKVALRKPAIPKRKITRIDRDRSFGYALSNAAINRTKQRVRYDGSYVKIGYPWGDVPKSIGVCTDVVIRSYRTLGIDLQQEVHRDISNDFYAYPNLAKWGLKKPDSNIDHRRVYNLQAFFKRHKAELPRSRNPRDYKPGDLVTWMVGPSFPHIGVVVNKRSKADPNRLMISHNIGSGPQIEDILFRFPMTGHYRYTPRNKNVNPALHFAKTPAPASVQRKNTINYNDLLKASRYLLGDGNKKKAQNKNDLLQVKKTKPSRINLAQLDSAALKVLLTN